MYLRYILKYMLQKYSINNKDDKQGGEAANRLFWRQTTK